MKGLKKRFFCNGNADVLAHDIELVHLSKQAGCLAWLIGFESISQKTIDEVGKKTNTVTEYYTAVKNIHDHHMAVIGCFIFGFDTDTPDIFDTTLHIINEIGVDVADFCVLTPFPGTPIYQKLKKEERLLTTDWSQYTLKNVVFHPKQMSPQQLQKGVQKMYIEFYSPLQVVKRITKNLRRGLYPFFLVFTRTLIAMMNSRKLHKTTQ